MIEQHLEILVITYNRAEFLGRTLEQLSGGPFARCRVTVLDNCSTDKTGEVCAANASRFPNFHTIRHRVNIGLAANYLRAVELSTSTYTWILCDDDTFDFSNCQDVIDQIASGTWDLISTGAPGQCDWERGMKTSAKELVSLGSRFFGVSSFFPCLIFRTGLFDAECFVKGYRNAANAYPNFPFLAKALRENFSIYVSESTIMRRDPHQMLDSPLQFWMIYVNSCAFIEDPVARRRAIYQITETRRAWYAELATIILAEKLHRPDHAMRRVAALVAGFSRDQRAALVILLPLIATPCLALKALRRIYRWLKGRPEPPPEKEVDMFRH